MSNPDSKTAWALTRYLITRMHSPQPNRMDAQSTGEAVMIDRTRVVGGLLFATHRERAWYLGRSNIEQRRWLLENPGRWWRIEDLQQEDATRRSPVEGDVNESGAATAPNRKSLKRNRREGP